MKKYLVMLVAMITFLALSGVVSSQEPIEPGECADCYANSIIQHDTQLIQNVESCPNSPIIYNEGIAAAVTMTPETPYQVIAVDDLGAPIYVGVGFSKTTQTMTQTIDTLVNPGGMTANKAMQASWIENQGAKEKEFDEAGTEDEWRYEAAGVRQNTVQLIYDVYYGVTAPTNPMAIFNADSKLAVISDGMDTLQKDVNVFSSTTDDQDASGTYSNSAEIDALITTYVNNMG